MRKITCSFVVLLALTMSIGNADDSELEVVNSIGLTTLPGATPDKSSAVFDQNARGSRHTIAHWGRTSASAQQGAREKFGILNDLYGTCSITSSRVVRHSSTSWTAYLYVYCS